ncbi:hypothetical protein [Paenibacillus thiaminolyticus]|uniref:hypothetical protein n=1 Tax=Paenibacillus thiaminolyticus TaxID=49283 RepID=UPI0025428900|nr:hypothetical protein [Paenibacillus thiaminolyticus]WII39060.1 hypothetical protein O0V01_08190 [Paenibacillus thiaminolyticus]
MAYGFEYSCQDSYNGQYVIGKGGAAPRGFHSWLWLLPEQNAGAFIVYNKSGNLREKLFEAFMDGIIQSKSKKSKPILRSREASRDASKAYIGMYG